MQALEKITYSNDWITLVFLFLLGIIVFLKLINAVKLKEQALALFNIAFIEDDSDEHGNFYGTFQVFMFLFSVFVFSLLVFEIKFYMSIGGQKELNSFLNVVAILSSYFILKGVLEYLLASLFLIKKRVHSLLLSKANYFYSVSFLIFVALIFFEYSGLNELFLFYFSAILMVIRFIFYLARNKKLILNKLFYFILYICAFEIAPLFLLFKLMF